MYHGVTQSTDADPAPDGDIPPESEEKSGKKERVLHTRVPAVLERELKRFAEDFRVPVSNLVRAILEDAVQLADAAGTGLEERLKRAAKTLETERERLRKKVAPDPLAEVFAFQEVTLAQPATCSRCGNSIPRGAKGHLGLPADAQAPGPKVIVCVACVPHE